MMRLGMLSYVLWCTSICVYSYILLRKCTSKCIQTNIHMHVSCMRRNSCLCIRQWECIHMSSAVLVIQDCIHMSSAVLVIQDCIHMSSAVLVIQDCIHMSSAVLVIQDCIHMTSAACIYKRVHAYKRSNGAAGRHHNMHVHFVLLDRCACIH